MSGIAFVDCETTGLHPTVHEIWEVGLIMPDDAAGPSRTESWPVEHHWFLPVDLSNADPFALELGRFHQRHPAGYDLGEESHFYASRFYVTPLSSFAQDFARLTHNLHLAGATVSFDTERLGTLLRSQGYIPTWHYHIVDIEALALGYLAAGRSVGKFSHLDFDKLLSLPWSSTELAEAVGVSVSEEDRHTALGDARWARAVWRAVMGSPQGGDM